MLCGSRSVRRVLLSVFLVGPGTAVANGPREEMVREDWAFQHRYAVVADRAGIPLAFQPFPNPSNLTFAQLQQP